MLFVGCTTIPVAQASDPTPGSGWLPWRRENGTEEDRYVVEAGGAEVERAVFTFPIPRHPGVPGSVTVQRARAFAELYLRP
jgi:hypothetical protein